MARILKNSKQVLFALVLLISAGFLILSFVPRLMGYSVCCVHDDSMQPQFPQGAYVLARQIPFAQIRAGDVLVFEEPDTGYTFLRRVVEVWTDKQQLVTMADTAKQPDPMTTAYSCVVGKVTHSVPYLGYPSVWLHTVFGKAVLALLYIIWISVEIEAFRVSKRREKSA